ncbi:MAG: hypothetical protein EOP04_02315 [Proteobacteria bacterium]|nr:MAG: hypothetical protein EOP04_02315 [Pseudomonadota bacterium]
MKGVAAAVQCFSPWWHLQVEQATAAEHPEEYLSNWFAPTSLVSVGVDQDFGQRPISIFIWLRFSILYMHVLLMLVYILTVNPYDVKITGKTENREEITFLQLF